MNRNDAGDSKVYGNTSGRMNWKGYRCGNGCGNKFINGYGNIIRGISHGTRTPSLAAICLSYASPAERALAKIARAYGSPDTTRSVLQLTLTVVPLIAIWLVMERTLEHGYWLTLAGSEWNLYVATCEMYESTEGERQSAYRELLTLPTTTMRGQAHAQL